MLPLVVRCDQVLCLLAVQGRRLQWLSSEFLVQGAFRSSALQWCVLVVVQWFSLPPGFAACQCRPLEQSLQESYQNLYSVRGLLVLGPKPRFPVASLLVVKLFGLAVFLSVRYECALVGQTKSANMQVSITVRNVATRLSALPILEGPAWGSGSGFSTVFWHFIISSVPS